MNGVIIINKPKGYTSHDIVNKIRKVLNIKKVGHTGTLDPNATGVLPILIGNATKVSKYLIEHNKTYIATIKLGERTNTLDSEGEIIESIEVDNTCMEIENIKRVLKTFLGKQEQLPPMYSAVKINGKKLYDYAKSGEEVERKPRELEIYYIDLISINKQKQELEFEVNCSKGTYIRVLCEDICKKLQTIGYMKELVRTSVDSDKSGDLQFSIERSIKLEELEKENIQKNLINIEQIFINKEKIDLNNTKLELFLNGVQLTFGLNNEIYRVYNNNKFIGIGIIKDKLLKRDIII